MIYFTLLFSYILLIYISLSKIVAFLILIILKLISKAKKLYTLYLNPIIYNLNIYSVIYTKPLVLIIYLNYKLIT